MKNKKKLAITTAFVLLVTSGVTFTLCQKRNKDYARYVNREIHGSIDDDYLLCAHRGFSSLAVENTKEALAKANESDYVDYIEFDIHMSKDKKFVLSHDDTLFTKEGDFIDIGSSMYDELMNMTFVYSSAYYRYYFWNSFEDIMISRRNKKLFHDYFKLIDLHDAIKECSDKKIIIDLKFANKDIIEYVTMLKKELEHIDTSNIVFQSLNIDGIKYLQDNSSYTCAVLISNEKDLYRINEFNNVGIKYQLVTDDLINELVKLNKKIAIWTVNDSREFDSVIDKLGDNYQDIVYISNNPDIIFTKLEEREKKLVK